MWLKRDDVGSLGLAGNKVRKLEFSLGEALAQRQRRRWSRSARRSPTTRGRRPRPRRGSGCRRCSSCAARTPAAGRPATCCSTSCSARRSGTPAPTTGPSSPRSSRRPPRSSTRTRCPRAARRRSATLGFAAAYEELLGQLDAAGLRAAARLPRVDVRRNARRAHARPRARAARPRAARVRRRPDRARRARPRDLARHRGRRAARRRPRPDRGRRPPRPLPARRRLRRVHRRGARGDPARSRAPRASSSTRSTAPRAWRASSPTPAPAASTSPVVFWHTGGGPSLFAAGWADELV